MPDNKDKRNSIFTGAVIGKGIAAGLVVLVIAAGAFWFLDSQKPEVVSDLLGSSEKEEVQPPLIDEPADKDTAADSSSSSKDKENSSSDKTDTSKENTENKTSTSNSSSSNSSNTDKNETGGTNSSSNSSVSSSQAQTSASRPAVPQTAPAPSAGESSSQSTGSSSSSTGSNTSQSSGNSSNFGYNTYPTTNNYPGHWSNGPYVLIYDTLVHASASTDSTWVANLKPGDVIQVKQVVKAADGKYWGQVENGWVNLAWGNTLYAINPGQPYYFVQNCAIRDNPSPSAKQIGTVNAGSTKTIYTILYRENEEFWGQLEKNKDQWVCLVDLSRFYVTKA